MRIILQIVNSWKIFGTIIVQSDYHNVLLMGNLTLVTDCLLTLEKLHLLNFANDGKFVRH